MRTTKTKAEMLSAIDAAIDRLTMTGEHKDHHKVLQHVSDAIGGHGVESIYQGDDKPSCLYVNMGDTYSRTVIFDEHRQSYIIRSWGDWLEDQEADGYVYN